MFTITPQNELNLTDGELEKARSFTLQQSVVVNALNDAKPVEIFICHGHQHKVCILSLRRS
ncbi:hypothetical protein [Pantoea sp. SGAir0183]